MLTTTVSPARALTPRGLLALVALICAWCAPGFAPAAQAQGFGNFFVQNATGEFYTREDDGQVQALIRIQVDPTWHLYHTELGHPEAIAKPTVVTFSAPGVTWSEPVFPEPHLYEQSEGVFIAGHEGLVVVRAVGTLEDGAAFPLDEEIEVTVAGQTCDPNMCTDGHGGRPGRAARGADRRGVPRVRGGQRHRPRGVRDGRQHARSGRG
jgi:hypothetical protein